jgi:DNA-binding NarL/FixJ family response regulator
MCLLDIDVPGGAIEAAATIRSRLPQTQVVMLSATATDADIFSAVESGASGYLLKEMNLRSWAERFGRHSAARLRCRALSRRA